MKPSPRSSLALVVSCGLLALGVACSDDPEIVSSIESDGGASDANVAETNAPVLDGGADADAASTDAADGATTDAGRKCSTEGWCHTALPDGDLVLRDVWMDGAGAAWTVSESGKVLRWDGNAWSVVFTSPGPLYAVWGSSPTDVWIGGQNGLYHATGTSSSKLDFQAIALSVPIMSLVGFGASDVWATGYSEDLDFTYATGRVLHYSGGTGAASSEWVEDDVTLASPALYAKIWGTGDDDLWIGGDGTWGEASVRHRVSDGQGGAIWTSDTTTPETPYAYFRSGFSLSRDLVWLTGFGSPGSYWVGRSPDNGLSFEWTEGTGAVPKSGFAQVGGWGSTPDNVWLAGVFGRLYHWNGTAWRPASIALDDVFPVINDFYAITGRHADDSDEVWVVGQGIALHKEAP